MTPDLAARPPLDRARLVAAGLDVEVLEETGSTNAVLAERARQGAAEGLLVVAEHQTAARGRLDRTWQAPPRSGLGFSVLLRPRVPASSWPWLPLLTGYAVGSTLRAAGHDAGVKWPNDVLIGERKVCGILLERVETPAGPAAVVGIGLNVDLTAEELPVPTATSLALASGAPVDRTGLLADLARALLDGYAQWQRDGTVAGRPLPEAYAAACVTLGRRVRVEMPGGTTLHGTAAALDPDGRLVVDAGHGPVAVGAGDVVHVRAV